MWKETCFQRRQKRQHFAKKVRDAEPNTFLQHILQWCANLSSSTHLHCTCTSPAALLVFFPCLSQEADTKRFHLSCLQLVDGCNIWDGGPTGSTGRNHDLLTIRRQEPNLGQTWKREEVRCAAVLTVSTHVPVESLRLPGTAGHPGCEATCRRSARAGADICGVLKRCSETTKEDNETKWPSPLTVSSRSVTCTLRRSATRRPRD